MKRALFASALAVLFSAASVPASFAQAKPAQAPPAQTSPPAATPGKWVPPVKGVANIEVIRSPSKRVGKELVTTMQIKNTSTGSINLLKVEELWYDAKRAIVSSGQSLWKKPFLPGEIITVEVRSPANGQPEVSQFSFAHANGKVNPKEVKKFTS